MEEDEIVEELLKRGIVLRGDHFRYSSGKHGEDYIDKNALLAHSSLAGALVHEMVVRRLDREDIPRPEVIVGPAMSGAILAHLVAMEFTRLPGWAFDEPVYAAFVEKDEKTGLFKLGRNYDKVVRDRNVLVVEDIINTGATAIAAAHAAMMAGGLVIGVSVIWNRGVESKLALPRPGAAPLTLPVDALIHRPFPAYTEAQCKERGPCARGIPLNLNFGHAAAFLAKDREKA
jgi:orotate phosphoribosyltransferase